MQKGGETGSSGNVNASDQASVHEQYEQRDNEY
jgi:hypothetical protein